MEEQQSDLWQRRLFEAESGLTKWLVETRGGEDLADWLSTQREIFSALAESDDPEYWKRTFFHAQALMERFVVSRYGEAELAQWTQASGDVYGHTAPEYGPGAAGLATRFAQQAASYASTYSVDECTSERASITISHCAIWDYREQARSSGTPLTLNSPCTYCTKLTAANARAKGYRASVSLAEQPDGHGCHWDIGRLA